MKHFLISLCFFVCCSLSGLSQTVKEKDTQTPASPEMKALRIATSLANYGYENNSATALVEAAKIFSTIRTQPLDAVSRPQPKDALQNGQEAGIKPEQLLADAKSIADKETLKYIKSVEKSISSKHRGAVGGPCSDCGLVAGGGTDTWEVQFERLRTAEVYVAGLKISDLDLYVFDVLGELVVCDEDNTSECYCSWTPILTKTYTIMVVNRGLLPNGYSIWTN